MNQSAQKEFNSTRAGQIAMADDAASRSVVLMLNAKVKFLGGSAWDVGFIESASPSMLANILEDLRQEYNAKVGDKA